MKDILDGEFLRQDKKILSKDDFIQRLKIWKQISKVGTLCIPPGCSNTKLGIFSF